MNLIELTSLWDQFKTSAIENAYNDWAEPKDLNPIANELIEAIKRYVEEEMSKMNLRRDDTNGPECK